MAYKIVYLEDLAPESIISDLESKGFEVVHCMPGNFEQTLQNIKVYNPDFILMDFRLKAGDLQFNAPPFAQYFRSESVSKNTFTPIGLISSEDEISGYYDDYTSFDLFDFAESKDNFSKNIDKFSALMSELIEGYASIETIKKENRFIELLNIPEDLEYDIDPRLEESLSLDQYSKDVHMVSSYIIGQIVKPIGVLIGVDVISARLGVSQDSDDWNNLLELLNDFKYTGIYSGSYERWWSVGFDDWWKQSISSTHPRRLNAQERTTEIVNKTGLDKLDPIKIPPEAISSGFWTICSATKVALDPAEGYELIIDSGSKPWIDPIYFSHSYLLDSDQGEINKLKEIDKERFLIKARS